MAQLIDTSIFITLERRRLTFADLADVVPDEPIALSAITVSELLMGVHRANTPERRVRRTMFVEAIVQAVPVLPFDLPVARIHAQIYSELAVSGQIIGAHDLIIAATALTHNCIVLTENVREFARVPDLTVRQPHWQ